MSDKWSILDFKTSLSRTSSANAYEVPTWVGGHLRRLNAYALLRSYMDNTSREFRSQFFEAGTYSKINTLESIFDPTTRITGLGTYNETREYGDPYTVRQLLLAAMLGDKQTVVVPGAAEARDARDAKDSSNHTITTEINADFVKALACEEYLIKWFDKEMMQMKLAEAEGDAIAYGDGVYVLGWDVDKHRDRLRIYAPDSYFPVIDPTSDDDFPVRLNIAYAFELDANTASKFGLSIDGPTKNIVRRITWELENGTCYYSDQYWEEGKTGAAYTRLGHKHESADVDNFDTGYAVYTEVFRKDLQRPYIPVIHMPNTVAGAQEHFGTSSLAMIAQLFDDLQNIDTDLQKASATSATPPIALIGSQLNKTADGTTTVNPGDIWEIETGGDLKSIDTSKSLDALLKLAEYLQKRLTSSSGLPEALLGKVDPTKAPSGLAIALTYSNLKSVIGLMRLPRKFKHGLLLKFVLDAAIRAKALGDTDPSLKDLPTDLDWMQENPQLVLGNFMPTDLSETVQQVILLVQNKAISIPTALTMLRNAGVPIASIADEARRISQNDFEAAAQLHTASGGDTKAVGKLLGLELDPPKPVAPVVAQGTPGKDATGAASKGNA